MEEVYSPYDNVLKIVKRAADILSYTDGDIEAIKYLERELEVVILIQMDDGTTKVLEGYRVQYSISRGPARGGVRFRPAVNPDGVRALATWMTLKYTMVNVPYGGGKGGVVCDPSELSENEVRAITRRYTAAIAPLIGPEQDIPAPDVGTNVPIMSWMMDTYSMLKNRRAHGTITGKPIYLGGALGRNKATGRGAIYITKNIPNKMRTPAGRTTVVIQGMGNVGSVAAKLLHREGIKIIAIGDVSGGIYNSDGLNVPAVLDYLSLSRKNLLKDYNGEGMSRITNEELLEMDTRVLVPAALENQINASNAHKIRVEVIVEVTNGPVAVDADGILQDGGIIVVPDILANAGDVVVSRFEWVQDIQSVDRTEEEVSEKLKSTMDPASEVIRDIAVKQDATLRTGAYLIVAKWVVEIKMTRAVWPQKESQEKQYRKYQKATVTGKSGTGDARSSTVYKRG